MGDVKRVRAAVLTSMRGMEVRTSGKRVRIKQLLDLGGERCALGEHGFQALGQLRQHRLGGCGGDRVGPGSTDAGRAAALRENLQHRPMGDFGTDGAFQGWVDTGEHSPRMRLLIRVASPGRAGRPPRTRRHGPRHGHRQRPDRGRLVHHDQDAFVAGEPVEDLPQLGPLFGNAASCSRVPSGAGPIAWSSPLPTSNPRNTP